MKKIISVVFIVAFGLSGCNDNKADQNQIQKKQQSGLGSWEPIPEDNNSKMPTF